jgi:sugar lactone lactonase YvrE
MAYDADGRIYIATRMGLQFCDQAGRLNGILLKPTVGELDAIAFGGAQLDVLYAFGEGRVFKRKTKVKGVRASDPPFKPKAPPL